MHGEALGWVLFNLFVALMLALDLGVFHRTAHDVRLREALAWSAVWIALALTFNVIIYYWLGSKAALEFLTGYLIEKSLSVDNLFLFVVIFSYFQIPPRYQHRVLFWGIIGALLARAAFILAGVALLRRFHFLVYVFGGFLVVTGLRMAVGRKEAEINAETNIILRVLRRLLPLSRGPAEGRFFVREDGRLRATPLLLVLAFVEVTDIVFALDSIPAILAVTTDAFIVYTSNVMAILGLRALYFALAGLLGLFEYLHYGLAAVLTFVGAKMLLQDVYDVPTAVSLGVVAVLLAASIVPSLLGRRPGPGEPACPTGNPTRSKTELTRDAPSLD